MPQVESWIRSDSFSGTSPVQTTERYLGCKQRIRGAVNDHIGYRTLASAPAPLERLADYTSKRLLRRIWPASRAPLAAFSPYFHQPTPGTVAISTRGHLSLAASSIHLR